MQHAGVGVWAGRGGGRGGVEGGEETCLDFVPKGEKLQHLGTFPCETHIQKRRRESRGAKVLQRLWRDLLKRCTWPRGGGACVLSGSSLGTAASAQLVLPAGDTSPLQTVAARTVLCSAPLMYLHSIILSCQNTSARGASPRCYFFPNRLLSSSQNL